MRLVNEAWEAAGKAGIMGQTYTLRGPAGCGCLVRGGRDVVWVGSMEGAEGRIMQRL